MNNTNNTITHKNPSHLIAPIAMMRDVDKKVNALMQVAVQTTGEGLNRVISSLQEAREKYCPFSSDATNAELSFLIAQLFFLNFKQSILIGSNTESRKQLNKAIVNFRIALDIPGLSGKQKSEMHICLAQALEENSQYRESQKNYLKAYFSVGVSEKTQLLASQGFDRCKCFLKDKAPMEIEDDDYLNEEVDAQARKALGEAKSHFSTIPFLPEDPSIKIPHDSEKTIRLLEEIESRYVQLTDDTNARVSLALADVFNATGRYDEAIQKSEMGLRYADASEETTTLLYRAKAKSLENIEKAHYLEHFCAQVSLSAEDIEKVGQDLESVVYDALKRAHYLLYSSPWEANCLLRSIEPHLRFVSDQANADFRLILGCSMQGISHSDQREEVNWREHAANAFRRGLEFKGASDDAKMKLYLQLGNLLQENNQSEEALKNYEKGSKFVDASDQVKAQLFLQWGRALASQGCNNAAFDVFMQGFTCTDIEESVKEGLRYELSRCGSCVTS